MNTGVTPQDRFIDAVARAAAAWREPDHALRAEAAAQTLSAPNRFTEEALAFAINQQMSLLTAKALSAWIGGRRTSHALTVGVLAAGDVPLDGLQDLLGVVLTGHRYLGTAPLTSPYLLPAFVREVRRYAPAIPALFGSEADMFEQADALFATVTDETRGDVEAACDRRGLPAVQRLFRGRRYAVGVLDGGEDEAVREGLAEDVLLHEGLSERNVALVWAPRSLPPDAYLESFAAFRSVFPAHPGTPGTLKLQQAFLAASGRPHAYGEGLEFLLSKGEAAVQAPGHVRWAEYDAIEEVSAWLARHAAEVSLVVATPALALRLPGHVPLVPPGEAHRPPLGWRPETLAFLSRLDQAV